MGFLNLTLTLALTLAVNLTPTPTPTALRGSPANERRIKLGYGVYEADLTTRSILDETAIWSDGPIMTCAARSVFA